MALNDLQSKLGRRLRWQQDAHRLERADPRLAGMLSALRAWQAGRLARSFAQFLADPATRPAAEFFLSDLYGDADFLQRDREAARILPKMARILPESLLQAAVDAIELAVLSHALDLRMARALLRAGVAPRALDTARYAEAYRSVGLPRLRRRQIDLVGEVGQRLDAVVQRHGVGKLLASARLPARLLGLQHLQGFLERGFAAFSRLGGAGDFLARIDRQERCIARRLAVGAEEPFAPPFS